MANPNRQPPSRSSSIPVPGTSTRNIENLLNISELTSSTYSPNRDRSQRVRPLYSGIESSRPSPGVRHASMSSSMSPHRHPLGGGSGPTWTARSISSSAAPMLPGSFGLQNIISNFEPRVIGSSSASATRNNITLSRQDTSTSPTRRPRTMANPHRQSSMPHSFPPRASHPMPPAQASGPIYGHHVQGSGAPVPMKRPPYLRHTAFHDLIKTDGVTSSTTSNLGRTSTPFLESDEDSEPSGSFSRTMIPHGERGRLRNRTIDVPKADPIFQLPTQWNEHDKHKHLLISEDGRSLHFHGPAAHTDSKSSAVARTNFPISPLCGIYYFEVNIQDKGTLGHISVGFSCAGVRLNRLPGWEKHSWGYHGDDGKIYTSSELNGTNFGPKFSTGDTIGCGIDFGTKRAFYTKNGEFLDYAFENIGTEPSEIYPAVGLRTIGEGVRANFGHEPFIYDITHHVHNTREKVWEKIQEPSVKWILDESRDIFEFKQDITSAGKQEVKKEQGGDDEFVPIKLPPDYSEPINKLVLSYLQHHGYERTANALKAQIDTRRKSTSAAEQAIQSDVDIKMETDGMDELGESLSLDQPLDDHETIGLRSRQQVVNAILSGDIDLGLRLLNELFPSVLELDDGFLHLKLKCRKFIELMLHASDAQELLRQQEAIQGVEIKENKSVAEADGGAMEVDDDSGQKPSTNGFTGDNNKSMSTIPRVVVAPVQSPSMKRSPSRSTPSPASVAYHAALTKALSYGKTLHAEYHPRSEAQALLKATFSLVSYDDPRKAGGEVQALTSQEARVTLAQEVNQAILKSQGRPSRPALERMYRQTGAVTLQLALMGVGDAAFVNMRSELLDA